MLRHAFPGPAPGAQYYDQYQDTPPGHYTVQPPHFRTQVSTIVRMFPARINICVRVTK